MKHSPHSPKHPKRSGKASSHATSGKGHLMLTPTNAKEFGHKSGAKH